MTTMLIFSILLVVSFTVAVIWRERELPESVSAMVNLFNGAWKWVWTIWIWVVTVTLAPPLIESLPETWKFLGFLTVTFLGVCGAMPVFMKDKKGVHDFFGIAAGFMSQLCVLFICPWWLILWVVMVVLLVARLLSFNERTSNDIMGVFIAEAICAVTLYGALFTA